MTFKLTKEEYQNLWALLDSGIGVRGDMALACKLHDQHPELMEGEEFIDEADDLVADEALQRILLQESGKEDPDNFPDDVEFELDKDDIQLIKEEMEEWN